MSILAPAGEQAARAQVLRWRQDVTAGTTLAIEMTWRVAAGASPVPQEVLIAFRDAVAEALRNVQRHSGQASATVDVVLSRQGLIVTVTDQGIGFDAEQASSATAGVGIGVSILTRMRATGGQAEIITAAGKGTTVLLEWWRGGDGRSRQAWHDLASSSLPGGANRRFRLLCLPPLIAQTFVSSQHAASPSQWGAIVALVVLTAVVAWRLDVRAPGVQELAVLPVIVGFVVALGTYGLPAGAFAISQAPITGFAAVPLCLVALSSRWWEALLSVLPAFAATVAVVVWRPELGVSPPIFIVTPLTIMAMWAVGDRLRMTAADSEAGQRIYRDQIAQLSWMREVADVQVARIDVVASTVGPFVAGIADGTDAITDAQRREAGLLAAAARDQLNWPVRLPPEVLVSLRRARERGVTIVLRPVDDPVLAGTAPWDLILLVVEWAALSRVTISYAAVWRLAILPGLDGSTQQELRRRWPHAHIVTEPARTVITLVSDLAVEIPLAAS